MMKRRGLFIGVVLGLLAGGLALLTRSTACEKPNASQSQSPHDAVTDAQTPKEVVVNGLNKRKPNTTAPTSLPRAKRRPLRERYSTRRIKVRSLVSTSIEIPSAL
jgi:hypothetical protein